MKIGDNNILECKGRCMSYIHVQLLSSLSLVYCHQQNKFETAALQQMLYSK